MYACWRPQPDNVLNTSRIEDCGTFDFSGPGKEKKEGQDPPTTVLNTYICSMQGTVLRMYICNCR